MYTSCLLLQATLPLQPGCDGSVCLSGRFTAHNRAANVLFLQAHNFALATRCTNKMHTYIHASTYVDAHTDVPPPSRTPTPHLDGCSDGQVEDEDSDKHGTHGQTASNALRATHGQVLPQHLITTTAATAAAVKSSAGGGSTCGYRRYSHNPSRQLLKTLPPLITSSSSDTDCASISCHP